MLLVRQQGPEGVEATGAVVSRPPEAAGHGDAGVAAGGAGVDRDESDLPYGLQAAGGVDRDGGVDQIGVLRDSQPRESRRRDRRGNVPLGG